MHLNHFQINDNDMFRRAFKWYFATKDKRNVRCVTCKHSKILMLQPVICHLHEYDGAIEKGGHSKTPDLTVRSAELQQKTYIALKDRVDYYYFYDLARLTLSSVFSSSEPSTRGKVRNVPFQSRGNYTTTTSRKSVTDGNSVQKIPSKMTNLRHVMFTTARDFHGKYGEFVIFSDSNDEDRSIPQVTSRNYQDMNVEISRIVWVQDSKRKFKVGTWFYGEPTGMVISRAYAGEDGKEGSSSDSSSGGGTAPAPPKDTAVPCSEGDDGDSEVKIKAEEGELIFIVYHHPPFVFVNVSMINVNSTVEQSSPPKDKTKMETIAIKTPEGSDSDKQPRVNLYFSGFLIDLLNAIEKRYKEIHKKDFPKYRIVLSRLFGPPRAEKGGGGGGEGGGGGGSEGGGGFASGGFGHREMAKSAGAGGGKDGKKEGEEEGSAAVKDFKGMVREVYCQKEKVALMPMTPTPERLLRVYFTEPFFETVSLSILMKKPLLQYHYWKFITVLEYSVWICISGAYFFTSLLLWFFDRSSPYSYRNDPERYKNDVEKRWFTIKESLWFCITSLTPQGGGEAPKALSGRLVAATWWLFGFIVIASYTANLAAFLTVSRLDHPINDFNELTRQYKVKYAPFEGSSTKTYFERMARIEEKFYQVWKDLSLNDDLDEDERAKLAVWDYPITDRFTKIWAAMTEASSHVGYNEAIFKVKSSGNDSREGNALVGELLEF